MEDARGDFPVSEDGRRWWDGKTWQQMPEHWLNAEEATSDVTQISGAEYPAIAELIEFGDDIDAYLSRLGIDPNAFTEEEERVWASAESPDDSS